MLRQRDALTVHQVSILERVVCCENFPIQDRIFAGPTDWWSNSSSETEESLEEAAESEDERNIEAVMNSRLGPPEKANDDLYRHGVTGTIHTEISGREVGLWKAYLRSDDLGSRCKVCEGCAR